MNPLLKIDTDDPYPESDGLPMADNTEQFEWIVKIKENLEILFADRPDVFVAGDLLWYPVPDRHISGPVAPDAMVVVGRPKGRRGSYKQWEEDDLPPQVVFEILSPSNSRQEMVTKRNFYQTYGVEEYYLYDPTRNRLEVWLRQEDRLCSVSHLKGWVSPRLGIRFAVGPETLRIYNPNGDPFLSPVELAQKAEQAKVQEEAEYQRAEQEHRRAEQADQRAEQADQRAEQADQRAEQADQRAGQERKRAEQADQRAGQERKRAEQADRRTEQERKRAEQADQRTEQERKYAEQADQRAERLAKRLLALGIDPTDLESD